MDFTHIAKFRKDITIKKHSPGEILLGFKASLMFDPDVKKLIKENTKKPAYIQKTKINILTQTISIQYDADIIPANLIEQLITAKTEKAWEKSLGLLNKHIHEA